MLMTKAFRRTALILWEKFQKEFPGVDQKSLVDVFEAYFIKKKKQGVVHADYYIELAKEIRKNGKVC
jgi:hypothetical protein